VGYIVRNQKGWQGAKRLLFTQIVITALASLGGLFLFDKDTARSALAGGLTCMLPNAYFAYRLFQYQGAQAAKLIVKSFYRAEAAKLLMTAALFVVVFKYLSVRPLPFFLTYIVVQMVFWAAPLIVDSKHKGKP